MKLACGRLPQDWQEHFGYPVQVVETFVDPQRFRGTCYKAAGWQRLGPTQGFERDWQDFYSDTSNSHFGSGRLAGAAWTGGAAAGEAQEK
jgi:hypothetical protein